MVFDSSKIFPGTTREVSIYIPAEYYPAQPACVYVNQDGIQWNAPVVFDNLIYQKEMPVTIGVFITPGIVKAKDQATALNRFNRSFEYDGLGDAYARFLLEEILPFAEKQHTSDGRAVHLSKTETTGPLADPAAEPYARLRLPGKDRPNFQSIFFPSARISACAAPTAIQS
ncbi:MAG: alpha/beta hydrolase-fold protein [Puia sp.]